MVTPINRSVIFSIDAETIGLYGEPFAVGFTVTDFQGTEIDHGYFACPYTSAKGEECNKEWVKLNVIPTLPETVTHDNPKALCEAVYALWMRVKADYNEVHAIADFGYPVETALFARMITVDEKDREYEGPYPLHELATALLVAGINRQDHPPFENEKLEHHPLHEARYSARLFCLAMNALKK